MAYTLSQIRQVVADLYLDKTDTKALRVADRIINSAMRLGAQVLDWEFFNKTGRINTVAQQSSGTVAVAAAGSTVTLTSATWPTGLVGMRIRIDSADADHEFGTRTGANTGTFVSGHQWNDDAVTTGTYILYKDRHSLAGDCRRFGQLVTEALDWDPLYMSYDGWLTYKAQNPRMSGDPGVVAHDNSYIYTWPPPETAEAIDYSYERWPASAATAGDSIDWPDQRIDVLYGLCGIQLDIHRGKISYDEGLLRARRMAWTLGNDDSKQKGPDIAKPMGDVPASFNNMEFSGS